jgi:NAD(P)-dependent dehydrogenase (short-subunit alcohol dehydrogenase family)
MKTILITGGTSGIGNGLAMAFLKKGDRVIAVGSTAAKGEMFYLEARKLGAEDRAHFLQADLSLVEENQRIIEEVKSKFHSLDILILCAQALKFSTMYSETKEGFEFNFGLYYLSRYILSYGLKSCLEQAEKPIILNICAPGLRGTIHWEDLQYKNQKKFTTIKAILHGSRLNDLLGVAFATNNTERKIKYILYNPGVVQTPGMTEAFEQPVMKLVTNLLFKIIGKQIEEAIKPILELLENPPESSLSAFQQRKEVNLVQEMFEKENAQRLFELTEVLLGKTSN